MAKTIGQNPASGRQAGCIPWLIICIGLVLALLSLVKTCNGPYWQAKQLSDEDPCYAAYLFAEEVRRDQRSSLDGVLALRELDGPCVLSQLIDLMDLPDGTHTNFQYRQAIWEDVQKRTMQWSGSTPPYDPTAIQKIRNQQEAAWRKWFEETFPAG